MEQNITYRTEHRTELKKSRNQTEQIRECMSITEETDTGIDAIDIDQLEGSFSKDVRYSMEVW